MFQFSKKLVFLLVVVSLLFGGGRISAEDLNACHKCSGDGGAHSSPYCNADHTGDDLGAGCDFDEMACYMRKNSDGLISKGCEDDSSKWKDANGNPKCITNQECYCKDKNFCNKDKKFGMSGGAGTPGAGGGPGSPGAGNSGSIGTKEMFRGISILFGMMAALAGTSVPSVFISS